MSQSFSNNSFHDAASAEGISMQPNHLGATAGESPREPLMVELSPSAAETLRCLFIHGPTWDGNVPSKRGRDELVHIGLVVQGNGWQWLTRAGFEACVANRLNVEKDSRATIERARQNDLKNYIAKLTKELECERARLAACGVAALANTRSSAAVRRVSPHDPSSSAAYHGVCAAVDREMDLRDGLDTTVRHFIGWLSGDIPELRRAEVPHLMDSWERFKARQAGT